MEALMAILIVIVVIAAVIAAVARSKRQGKILVRGSGRQLPPPGNSPASGERP